MKKTIIFLICAIFILSSCTIAGDGLISYGSTDISENLFFFELCYRKTAFLNSVLNLTEDAPAIWSQKSGDTTLDQAIKNIALEECCKLAFFAEWARDNGYELTDSEEKSVQDTVDAMLSQFKSKAELNLYLESYGMNYELYEEYCNLQMLAQKGMSYYYQVSEDAITQEELTDLYEKMFITVKHIFVNTVSKGADSDGNTVELSEEEKAQKLVKVENIMAQLSSGVPFEDCYELTEDTMAKNYPDGYTLTQGVTKLAEYESAAFELEVGEYTRIDVDGVGSYIIKRYPTSEKDFENCYSYILQMLVQTKSSLLIESMTDEFDINQEILANYTTENAPLLK